MGFTGNKRRARWLWMYTVMFLCGAGALAVIAKYYGRTLIWNPDGYKQPYTVIAYIGQMLRGLFSGEGYRMVDFSLGQGLDVLTTYGFYGYTDPLNMLGVLGQGNAWEDIYMLITFLHIYLAGVAFGVYARTLRVRDDWAIACSALICTFGGYIIYMAGRHPQFINGVLYLALLLAGIERVLQARKWLMYVIVTALMLFVNFYFAFINTVIAIVYIIVRLIARIKERGIKASAGDGFMLLGGYVLGAALSAVVFVPVVIAYAQNSRLGVEAGYTASMLSYGMEYYWDILMFMFAPWQTPGEFLLINYAPLALFALMELCCIRSRRARQMRVGLILCVIVMLIPAAGRLLNGMGYVSQRWSYAIGLFIALGCLEGLPLLMEEGRLRKRKIIALAGMAYAFVLAVNAAITKDWPQLLAPVFIGGFAVLLLVYDRGWLKQSRMRRITAAFLMVTVVCYIAIGYMPQGYYYIGEQQKTGVYDRIYNKAAAQLIEDEGVYRVGQGNYDDPNAPILGYMGTSFYWSVVDQEISEYYRQLAMPLQTATYNINNLGGSAAANAVAAVKYYIRHEKANDVIPYGYGVAEELELPNGKMAYVYENEYALPLGYAYDTIMPVEDYCALDVPEKYQALLSHAVCDRESMTQEEPFADASFEIAYSIDEISDVDMGENIFSARKKGSVVVGFEAPEDCEIYLLIQGLKLADAGSMRTGYVTVSSAYGETEANVPSPRSNFYFPKENYAFCLGTGEEAMQSCTIRFDNKMDYEYDDIRLIAIPLSGYRENVEARRRESMENVELSNNRISGTISVAGDRILQIAVPYSDGWSAWVDGEETEVFRCGGMYMGVELEEGAHEIEMRYVTPGLRTGAMVSLLAAALTIALAAVGKIRKRQM